ncbi:MerR family transcriptional regulator [Azospirillum argentinense]
MDPTQTFTAGQVEDLTDINPETLRVWRRRGFIPPNPGGGWARYSFGSVVLIGTLLDLTATHRLDVSEAWDKFIRGAGDFYIREAAAAALNGQPDVWVVLVFSDVREGGRSWKLIKTDDPATVYRDVKAIRSVLAINVGDVARGIIARIERLEGSDDDDAE